MNISPEDMEELRATLTEIKYVVDREGLHAAQDLVADAHEILDRCWEG